MNRLRLSTLTALCLLGTGCAATSGAQGAASGVALGDASGEPLRLEGAAITGPHSSLVIEEDGMRGRFRTHSVALKWDYQQLTGSVGDLATCAYALKREGDGFKGMRECGGTLEKDLHVSFPQALATRPVGERAALMTLMLVNLKSAPVAPIMGFKPRGGVERQNKFSDCRYASF